MKTLKIKTSKRLFETIANGTKKNIAVRNIPAKKSDKILFCEYDKDTKNMTGKIALAEITKIDRLIEYMVISLKILP